MVTSPTSTRRYSNSDDSMISLTSPAMMAFFPDPRRQLGLDLRREFVTAGRRRPGDVHAGYAGDGQQRAGLTSRGRDAGRDRIRIVQYAADHVRIEFQAGQPAERGRRRI